MTENGGDGWSSSTRVTTAPRDSTSDVDVARRGVASFGGGGPRIGDSVRSFVRRYGWRAYALPILVAVSVVALLTAHNAAPGNKHTAAAKPAGGPSAASGTGAGASSPPVAPDTISLKSDAAGSAAYQHALKIGVLPHGGSFTTAGDGTYRVLKGTSKAAGTGQLYRYDIEVENGITGVDLTQFASMVQSTLANAKSWSGHGVMVQRVDSGQIDFHVSLTSSMTVRQFCGYDIPVETSCYATAGSGAGLDVNRVVLNVARWVRGASPYIGDLQAYRIYMINHEDGHALGHRHAHQCLPGNLAPVMMQQTFGLKSATTGKNCEANPWPYPPGAKGAPGAEQQDTPQNNEYYLGD